MANKNRIGISISLDKETLKLIDESRGRVPRSRCIEDNLIALFNRDSPQGRKSDVAIQKMIDESLERITKDLREKFMPLPVE